VTRAFGGPRVQSHSCIALLDRHEPVETDLETVHIRFMMPGKQRCHLVGRKRPRDLPDKQIPATVRDATHETRKTDNIFFIHRIHSIDSI
jgi:hypothetical protein